MSTQKNTNAINYSLEPAVVYGAQPYQQPYQQPHQQRYQQAPPNHQYQLAPFQSPTTINLSNQPQGTFCPICGCATQSIAIPSYGSVVWIWCLALFILTCFCFFIPFLMPQCQDTKYVCARCRSIKYTVPAQCC